MRREKQVCTYEFQKKLSPAGPPFMQKDVSEIKANGSKKDSKSPTADLDGQLEKTESPRINVMQGVDNGGKNAGSGLFIAAISPTLMLALSFLYSIQLS